MKTFGVPQSFAIRAARESFDGYDNIGTASLASCSAVFAIFQDGSIFFGHFMASQYSVGNKKEEAKNLEQFFKEASMVKVWYSSDHEDSFTKDRANKKKLLHPTLKYSAIVKSPLDIQAVKGGTVIIDKHGKIIKDGNDKFSNISDYANRAVSNAGLNDPGFCILVNEVSETCFQDALKSL